jgi:hypothetical protein
VTVRLAVAVRDAGVRVAVAERAGVTGSVAGLECPRAAVADRDGVTGREAVRVSAPPVTLAVAVRDGVTVSEAEAEPRVSRIWMPAESRMLLPALSRIGVP